MTDDQIKRTWLLETGVEEETVPFAVLDFARAIERRALERAIKVLDDKFYWSASARVRELLPAASSVASKEEQA